ncbi:bifunctional indole-3-glycerol-phosphate synthase TrpC/phosphoribosylanthranilate isomerase TrpF [Aliidiomarina minuta]|uniref:Multifunctional fusion protein n=1 Tax=Aliidiomarina minuta TaxID=880057 RepID=A0A432W7Y7_9GAMM|nr:bifunctional indole-3-glycerol-phosphate synthase TrpC/phosphoribosylanthranilate isomerase TrpF [Aliidiomarina minuta]RUO26139.1 bifunctional indole-3-glycerol-phosphate synthase TrpC/phosphoribosylanthranilate isomerase TrpF [Aliidiomarina minuta]
MSDILQRITNQRRERIQELAQDYPLDSLRLKLEQLPERPVRSLHRQLSRADKGFILECKKASPSKGLIRENFDPLAIAHTYQPYAAAISVLTEPDFFQGSFAYLQAVSRQVQVPVLCKDFIVDPLQIYLARYFGADAILLMLSLLDDAQYRKLANLAEELGLEILTEVSNVEEMQRTHDLNAAIIGINHRDLRDLSIDLTRSQQLAKLAPAGALLVAESGISSNQQVRDIGRHVDGFLVGSHLSAQADIDQACRRLIYGDHKVCGLTRPDDALMAKSAGAIYGGLIFAARSPRFIDIKQAHDIIDAVPALNYVAVITEHSVSGVLALVDELPLHAVQLHGQQSPQFVNELVQKLNGRCQVWYALKVESAVSLPDLPVDRFLLDNGNGGSGQTFDWQHLPANQRNTCMLAGGLSQDNIEAAAQLGVAGLDINSGAEIKAGEKDGATLHAIFSKLSACYRKPTTQEMPL